MLKSKKLPKAFWEEAVTCSRDIPDRCPTSSLNNITPQEAWKENPTLDTLKFFAILHMHTYLIIQIIKEKDVALWVIANKQKANGCITMQIANKL